jgi:hypothetical protein
MTTPTPADLCASVSATALMRHVTEFARWTKHAGTPEELESLKFISAEFDSYGFDTEISAPAPSRISRATICAARSP